jgi:predicted nucleic acid-binding Zn ribbon protein
MLSPMAKKRIPSEAESVGQVLEGVMTRINLIRLDWIDDLAHAWPEVAGKAVAAHTRPARMEGPRLIVYVDQHVWMQELQRSGKKPLLANIWKRFGANKVKDILFRLDPGH